MGDANVDVVRRIEAAWAESDLDALDDLIAADYTPHIRRRGEARPAHDPRVEPRRWPVERTHAWHNRFRRLLIRWEKKTENWLALIHFANALIAFRACYW